MINLKVEEYCHGCRDFESDTHYDWPEINNISIFCKHRNKCAQLKKYIEKQSEEKSADTELIHIKKIELCESCEYSILHSCKVLKGGCGNCPLRVASGCKCPTIPLNEPCPYYKEAKK